MNTLRTPLIAAWAAMLLLGCGLATIDAAEVDELNATVQSEDATLHEKAVACKRLAAIGNEASIEAVTPLLYDETLSHYARFTLEPMPYEAAGAALREALGKLEGDLRVGMINSLGIRRDTESIEALATLMQGDDAKTSGAAAAALGRIGNAETAALLEEALGAALAAPADEVADAALVGAEMLLAEGHGSESVALFDAVREADLPQRHLLAATRGAILARGEEGVDLLAEQLGAEDFAYFALALRAARELDADGVAEVLVETLDAASPARQALLVVALADRGDEAGREPVASLAAEGPAEVRLAAIRALGRLGDASTLDVLVAAAAEGEHTEAALASLARLPQAVDPAIRELLADDDATVRRVALDAIGERRLFAALPEVLEAAEDDDEAVRLAALGALGEIAPLEDFDALTSRVVDPRSPAEREAAQAAIRAAITRMPDRDATAEELLSAMEGAPVEAQVFFLEVLGTLGGPRALEGVTAAARSESDAIQDAATRILGEWIGTDAAPALLQLAQTGPERFRIRCLRGYIRIIRQFDMPENERMAMSQRALVAATRDEERRLVFEVLERYPAADGLRLVVRGLESASLREDAASAAVAIGEDIVGDHPAVVARAMQAVLDAGVSDDLAARARNLLDRAQQ